MVLNTTLSINGIFMRKILCHWVESIIPYNKCKEVSTPLSSFSIIELYAIIC